MSILCLAIQIAFVVSIVAVVYYFRLYKLHGISVKEWKEMQEDNFLMRELLDNLAQLQISVAYFCSIGLYFLV